MYKKILMILFLIILSHCSLNHPVSMWKVEEENINIPFNHMVFFGDGETDIPSFRIVSGGGGCSVCVYDPLKEKSKKIADQLVQDQRVQHAVKNDYSEGEELDTVIKNFILSL